MRPFVLCFSGYSGSGKTTLLEKLIPLLKKEGIRVGVIKHDVHGIFTDEPGKDSYRLKQAGADTVCVLGPDQVFLNGEHIREESVARLAETWFSDCRLLLLEGFKKSPWPKIEVYRKANGKPELGGDSPSVLAVVSDDRTEKEVPHFSFNQLFELVSFIKKLMMQENETDQKVRLVVDGEEIRLKPFIDTMFLESILGMLKALKGCEQAGHVSIEFTRPEN